MDIEKTAQLLNGLTDLTKALSGTTFVQGYFSPYWNPITGFDYKQLAKDKAVPVLLIGGTLYVGWKAIGWYKNRKPKPKVT